MKKIYLTSLLSLFTIGISNAQWITTGTNIIATNNNVGIGGVGTSNPNSKLEVFGTFTTGGSNANIDPVLVNLNYLANSSKMLIGWNRTAGDGETDFISNQGAGGLGGFAFYNFSNSSVLTPLMWIRGNGDVSIGTKDSKGYRLAVNGKIRAQEIKVEADGWPDYVFKPSYSLPTLNEVKLYIDKNQHLPDMPSEKEVASNGINLGEMNKLLTKKIEELTLYLIEKDKIINDEQKTNSKQEQRIGKLETQLKDLIESLKSNLHPVKNK